MQLKPGDTIRCIKTFWHSETQTRFKEGHIVKNMTQFDIDCLSHPECWEKVKSTRELAIEWWSTLKVSEKSSVFRKYHSSGVTTLIDLTGREIEEIWRKENFYTLKETKENIKNFKLDQKQYSQEEVDRLLDQQAARTTSQLIGNPSVGQFKEASESLMSVYLDKFDDEGKMKFFKVLMDKFSDEDKIWALKTLVKTMPE